MQYGDRLADFTVHPMRAMKRLLVLALMAATLTACSGSARSDAAREGGDDPFIIRGQVSVGGMSSSPTQVPGPR